MVMLERVSTENDSEPRPEPMHWPLVTEVLGGVCHQESNRQNEQLLPAWLTHPGNGEGDYRQRPEGGKCKVQPARVPASNFPGSVLRTKPCGGHGCFDHSSPVAQIDAVTAVP